MSFFPFFKKKRIFIGNTNNIGKKSDIIRNEDEIYNFKQDYCTESRTNHMIIHKPYELIINGKTFVNGPKIGKGTYSKVYKLNRKKKPIDNSKALVAKIFKGTSSYKKSAIDEINSLTILKDCPFIVDLVVYFKITNNHIAIITPYYNYNLYDYIGIYLSNTTIDYDSYMCVFVSLLSAISYMIKYDVLSTDLKPENIFLNVCMNGTIKKVVLGDFSSPLFLKTQDVQRYSYNAQTLYYRSPEIIFVVDIPHLKHMDLWSLGCVLYELYFKKILFNCKSLNKDRIKSNNVIFVKIVSMTGLPHRSYFEKYNIDFDETLKHKEPKTELSEQFSKMPYGLELVLKYLNWDPYERPTPEYSLEYINRHNL